MTYYLLGAAEQIAERVHERIEAFDSQVDQIVLYPVSCQKQLERVRSDVMPRLDRRQPGRDTSF